MMFFSVKPRDMALDFLPLHLLGFGFGLFHDISREFNFDIFDLTTLYHATTKAVSYKKPIFSSI